MPVTLSRRLLAECLGSALLTAVVIGSGIEAERLSSGNVGLELFENAAVTAAGLFAILLALGPVSGAHLNPVVSGIDMLLGGISWQDALAYLPAQVSGCCGGAVLANLMFSRAAVTVSTHRRASGGHLLGEVVATAGLVVVVFSLARSGRAERTPAAVACYIGAAYFFTSSTSFANPAIAIGRMLSDTFAGIAPSSVPLFVLAELSGGVVGYGLLRCLYPSFDKSAAEAVTLPHDGAPAARCARTSLMARRPIVLFLCIHNAGRSLAARVLLEHYSAGRIEVLSAGSEPADELNPSVVAVLRERGLDPSREFPKPLTDETVKHTDVVVTMGCGDTCPYYPGKRYLDWELEDPAGKTVEQVRPIVDEIDRRVQALLRELTGQSAERS